MNKKQKVGIISIVALIVIGITLLTIGYRTSKDTDDNLLTLKTIVKTFETQGVSMEEDKTKSANDFEIYGVKPHVFNVEKDKGILLVYIFETIEERRNLLMGFEEDKLIKSLKFSYNAKNSYLVYIPELSDESSIEEWESASVIIQLIPDIVFKYFNEGKVIVFSGESTSWSGTFTLKYYEYFWNDKDGKLNYESYHQKFPEILYKMEDIEAVGTIDFEYDTNSGGGSSTRDSLDKDGYSSFGGSGGNGTFPKSDQEISFTIKWNDLEENMILKAN